MFIVQIVLLQNLFETVETPALWIVQIIWFNHRVIGQVICKDYSDKYLPHEDQTITLCHPPGSRKRDANLKISADGAYIFSTGWRSLARGNELQDGDACAFEASMSEGRVTVSVHPLHGSYSPPGDATLTLHIPLYQL